MRIAMLSEHGSPLAVLGGTDAGGQNAHVAELSAALAAAGHDVRVYTRRDDPALPTTVGDANGYDVVHVPAGPAEWLAKDELLPYLPEFSRWLVDRWRSGNWQPEVIHAHYWMSGLVALTTGRQVGRPVVQTYQDLGVVKRRHQGVQDTSPACRIASERELGCRVDRVVAQCSDEVGELVRLGVPRSQIVVVPAGVNVAALAPRPGTAVARAAGRFRLLTVGRLVPRKGFATVIRAMAPLPDAECVVVGGPPGALEADPSAQRLWALAEECGVADRVQLVGAVPREAMGDWYRSADVLVAAPWYEPFGLTLLEAMACGLPVVGTAVGGLRDTVVDGVTGDLVPARSPRALSTALRRLLDDEPRRSAYASAGRERAQTYSWSATAERLVELYAEVAAVRRSTLG